ncbi:antirepressor [Pasteurellaceae bacterium Orientalotternb1]|nr:antirepressor [Pasteurellaceae bacterium Orientalotternb1]
MPITTFQGVIANQSTLLVNARELHERLQISTRFDIWINRRISEYSFVENLDFIERSNLNNRGFFKTEVKDYHLTLDMAKELCMLERSELGRQARRYFIEQEKHARTLAEQNAKLLASIPPFLLSNPDTTTRLIERAQNAFFVAHPEGKEILRYREMGLTNAEIAKLLNIGKTTLKRRLATIFSLGLAERKPSPFGVKAAQSTQLTLMV